MPKVSIIIVNWNGLHYLKELMDTIEGQSFRDFETIIVDNGSTDGSVNWIRENYPGVKLLPQKKNLGFCAGNNIGALAASGDYFFLLNNDTALRPDALKEMLVVMEEKGESCFGVFPEVLFYDEPYVINAMGVVWNHECQWKDIRVGLLDFGQFKEPEQVFGSIFAAVLVRAKVFLDIGMFDEAFFSYGEDFDVCYRANLMGYKFFTAPEAEVLHKYRGSSVEKKKPAYSHFIYTRNYLMAILKNYSSQSLRKHFGQAFRRYITAGIRHFLRERNITMVWAHVRAVIEIVILLPHIKSERKKIQYRRKVSDYELWNWSHVEGYNILHYQATIVLSLGNLASTFQEKREYDVNGIKYTTV